MFVNKNHITFYWYSGCNNKYLLQKKDYKNNMYVFVLVNRVTLKDNKSLWYLVGPYLAGPYWSNF